MRAGCETNRSDVSTAGGDSELSRYRTDPAIHYVMLIHTKHNAQYLVELNYVYPGYQINFSYDGNVLITFGHYISKGITARYKNLHFKSINVLHTHKSFSVFD